MDGGRSTAPVSVAVTVGSITSATLAGGDITRLLASLYTRYTETGETVTAFQLKTASRAARTARSSLPRPGGVTLLQPPHTGSSIRRTRPAFTPHATVEPVLSLHSRTRSAGSTVNTSVAGA